MKNDVKQPFNECRYTTCNGDCKNCHVFWFRIKSIYQLFQKHT